MNIPAPAEIRSILAGLKAAVLEEINKKYSLGTFNPLLREVIFDYSLREGKMIRPVLFILSFCGYGGTPGSGIYRCALGLEFLHNCALIHDDIIDLSKIRRGGPAMHALIAERLEESGSRNCPGEELAIITGDIFYSIGIRLLTEAGAEAELKEKALRNILDAAALTGVGEFSELIRETQENKPLSLKDLLRIYDSKTSYYTFICPLQAGAMLTGAGQWELNKLKTLGKYAGRAFQVRNDLSDISPLPGGRDRYSELRRKKKNILFYYALKTLGEDTLQEFSRLFNNEPFTECTAERIYRIYEKHGIISRADKLAETLKEKAGEAVKTLDTDENFREILYSYCAEILEK